MKLVIVESPFAGKGETEQERKKDREHNVLYARACLNDCLIRHDEAPYASHLLYTQKGILNDDIQEQRKLGIEAGLKWGEKAELTVVYLDKGLSKGMIQGIKRAQRNDREVQYRLHLDYLGSSNLVKYFCDRELVEVHDLYLATEKESAAFHTYLTGAKGEDQTILEYLQELQR